MVGMIDLGLRRIGRLVQPPAPLDVSSALPQGVSASWIYRMLGQERVPTLWRCLNIGCFVVVST